MRKKELTKRFNVVITKDGKFYVARCLSPDVVSQGRTLKEARKNIKEAIELYLESFGTPSDAEKKVYLTTVEARIAS